MATRHLQGGAPASPALPLDVILSAIPSFPRPVLARLTARLIDHMDQLDGDPDLEPNGDELDGSLVEDEAGIFLSDYRGPGCIISDPGGTYGLDC
jgi:hypothetical protein